MINLDDEWRKFEDQVLPKHAGANQRREMRRAFMAGVAVSLGLLDLIADQDEDRGVEWIADMHRQCLGFADLVSMGAA